MWRYISGVSNPTKRKIEDTEDRKEYYKDYECKRKRMWKATWKEGRPWLEDSEKGMLCTVCTKHYTKGSTFTTGCQSYKLDSVVKHEQSKSHKRSIEIDDGLKKPVLESAAGKIIKSLNSDHVAKLTKMFRTCHALMMKNRPLSDYEWQCDLDEVKGTEVGSTYRNSESAKRFIESIAYTELEKVTTQVKMAKFACVIGDGSTDSSVSEQEMWFVRTSVAGNIVVNFMGVHGTERADAQHIVDGLKHLLHTNLNITWESFSEKVVALSCDGASVMTGCKAGVGALLRADQQNLVTIHCMAHRLELSLKDVMKKVPLYQKAAILLKGLFLFYHRSSLNNAMLRRTFDALKSSGEKLLLPTRADGTRWIGHQLLAVTNIITSYKFITAHLGQLLETGERVSSDAKSKAKGFMNLLKSKDMLCFLHFMVDAFTPLRKLSLALQEQNGILANQHAALNATLEAIDKLKTSDGPNLRKVKDESDFQGVRLVNTNARSFNSARSILLDKLHDSLKTRFSEFTSHTDIIGCTRIADLKAWPQNWDSLKVYGDEDVRMLVDHFSETLKGAGVSVEEAELEWTPLKKSLFESDFKKSTLPDWPEVHRRFSDEYPNILAVVDLILTMAPSSAQAERGFSQLKLVKTNIRSRLGQSSLNNALAIKFLSADIKDFDPSNAINHWSTCSLLTRRPNVRVRRYEHKESDMGVESVESVEETVVVNDVTESVESQGVESNGHLIDHDDQDISLENDEDDIESEDEREVFERIIEMEIEYEH